MSKDLIELLRQAEESGALPRPASGETMGSYRLRVAHAGAVVGIAFAVGQAPVPPAPPADGWCAAWHDGYVCNLGTGHVGAHQSVTTAGTITWPRTDEDES